MSNIQLKQLSKIGYTNNQARSIAIEVMSKHYKHHSSEDVMTLLTAIRSHPQNYTVHDTLSKIAHCFIEKVSDINFESHDLLTEARPLKTYGTKHIDTTAKQQMNLALRLPVAVRGALMPDAHAGYGLPIGGVLAVENAVIPYGIGVDIGCRMAMTIFDANERAFNQYHFQCKKALNDWTHFGMEGGLETKQQHEVLDHKLFDEIALIKKLKGKAYKQLGSSGSGNHFVEWGLIDLRADNALQLKAGRYIALLSHSGSRGLGAN
ncbi:MAG: RtcB family protein, partial [Chitinophagaceae bacterium]|nr:RtcB family protein [Chitinophagaceae bacterium]